MIKKPEPSSLVMTTSSPTAAIILHLMFVGNLFQQSLDRFRFNRGDRLFIKHIFINHIINDIMEPSNIR